jgi:hypothetical protein
MATSSHEVSQSSPLALELVGRATSASQKESLDLAILRDVLPDGDEDLAVQFDDLPRVFTLFPQLPRKLRLKIWRLLFPAGRHITLDSSFGLIPYEYENAWQSERKTPK